MNEIEVRNQTELDAALERQDVQDREALIVVCGDGRFVFTKGSPRVESRGSSSPRVESWGSSSPRVVSRGSSSPRVVSWGSSSPRVESWESSSPRVESWESSSPRVESWESSSPRVVSRGSSSPRVESWESSSPTVESWESSSPRVESRGSSSPRVESRGSSSPRVVSRGSSSPRVESWESSSPRVESRGSSSPRVESRGSSSPRVESWESSSVTGATGSYAQPRFWRYHSSQINIPGAVILGQPEIKTAEEWLDYYGIEAEDGIATLFKAVGDDYVSSRGFAYEPGSQPECDDWNADPEIECGEGLHFCPAPSVARGYRNDATKFVACPIAVSDIVVSEGGGIPDKVRAPKVSSPIWECDIDGEPLAVGEIADAA